MTLHDFQSLLVSVVNTFGFIIDFYFAVLFVENLVCNFAHQFFFSHLECVGFGFGFKLFFTPFYDHISQMTRKIRGTID